MTKVAADGGRVVRHRPGARRVGHATRGALTCTSPGWRDAVDPGTVGAAMPRRRTSVCPAPIAGAGRLVPVLPPGV